MSDTHTLTPPTPILDLPSTEDELLARVAALVPAIRARASEAEDLRRLPDETIEDLYRAGVFHMHVPKDCGGSEFGLETHHEAMRLLAHGCVSTAWVTSFLAMAAPQVSRFPIELQREIFLSPNYRGTSGTNQSRSGTRAVRVDGGYVLNGRWGFASGVMHSEWTRLSAPVEGQPGEQSGRIYCMVKVSEIEIDDIWHTTGMRGTGSNSLVIKDLFVPEERTVPADVYMSGDHPGIAMRPDYLLGRFPIYRLVAVMHTAYTLGAAERALEIFRDEIAPKRQRPWNSGLLDDLPVIHFRFGQAVHEVQLARLLAEENLRIVVNGMDEGYSIEERAHSTLGSTGSVAAAGRAVTILARNAGGSIHLVGNELDRIQRDMEVLQNHSTGDLDFAAEAAGRVMLGHELVVRPEEFF